MARAPPGRDSSRRNDLATPRANRQYDHSHFPFARPAMQVPETHCKETLVSRIVYIVGAVVIIIALLSFFGLR